MVVSPSSIESVIPRSPRTPSNNAASSSSAAGISHANYECHNCGRIGHVDNTDPICPFHGQDRVFHRDAELGTQGRNPHMRQVNAVPAPGGMRIDGIMYLKGRGVIGAPHTPEQNNCLIDSLRQCLSEVHGSPFLCDRNFVRADLQKLFPAGNADPVTFSSFLDVKAHGEAILQSLFAHTTSHRHVDFRLESYCIRALTKDHQDQGDVIGSNDAPHRLHVLNVGQNSHFDPLLRNLQGVGPVTVPKLSADGTGRMGGHFDRLIPASSAAAFASAAKNALRDRSLEEDEDDETASGSSRSCGPRQLNDDDAALAYAIDVEMATSLLEANETEVRQIANVSGGILQNCLFQEKDIATATVVSGFTAEKEVGRQALASEAKQRKIRHPINKSTIVSSSSDTQDRTEICPPPPPPPLENTQADNIMDSGEEGEGKDKESVQFNIKCMLRSEASVRAQDPRALLDEQIQVLADALRDHPTVPGAGQSSSSASEAVFNDSEAVLLPAKHCAFKHCSWTLEWCDNVDEMSELDREEKVVGHLLEAHKDAFESALKLLPRMYVDEEKVAGLYNEAIGWRVRQGAPLASYSIDRKCLRKAALATGKHKIQGLVCFLCGCIHPYRENEIKQPIRWRRPMQTVNKFFCYDAKATKDYFSLDSYLAKYGKDPLHFYDLNRHMDEFDDWLVDVQLWSERVRILCCPEDLECSHCSNKHATSSEKPKQLCKECHVPVCRSCDEGMVWTEERISFPPAALANDLMVFYAPEEIYANGGLTIMEMICASTCITSMICFSMEVKYGNLFDSKLHMHRHRVGARGNATTFLLPWEGILAELENLESKASLSGQGPELPRTGKELQYVVQVLLKTGDEDKRDNLKHFIHQAQVNREKVINCILAMKRRGHRAYVHVDEDKMRARAQELPEQGVPPEVISLLPNDNSFEKLRIQKAATPVEGMKEIDEAAKAFSQERPNAVVLENSCSEEGDIQIRRSAAIHALVTKLDPASVPTTPGSGDSVQQLQQKIRVKRFYATMVLQSILQLCTTMLDTTDVRSFLRTCNNAGHSYTPEMELTVSRKDLLQSLKDLHLRDEASNEMHRFVMSSGSAMQPQFKSWYFGVAFAFLFKFCTGMPDQPEWAKDARHRRSGDAPRVELGLWVRIMTRRVEQHLKRDWLFGFSMWNVLFRSTINQCRTVYSYERIRRADGSTGYTAEELQNGAISICQALDGKYKDLDGKLKKVNGDFTKVKYATNINEAGKRLLMNLAHTTRQVKGTMEVRKLMRYETNAGRVRRGVPIFVTWSPDEKHNVLMIRLHRSRENDPIHQLDSENKKYGRRKEPPMDKDYIDMKVSCDEMLKWLPDYDSRRAIIARDALSSVEGFRMSVLLTCEYVFGMRVCPKCPDCNHGAGDSDELNKFQICCQDIFGNNAYSDGGSFGRAEGIYISIEAQKSAGSLHSHGQLHIACIHQHTPLAEIMHVLPQKGKTLVLEYLRYKNHVCRQVYADVQGWEKQRRSHTEQEWPEYKNSVSLVSMRRYLTDDAMNPTDWLTKYLQEHVQEIQEKKQNHVHVLNAKGERVPLAHCQRADNPSKCKSDFPRPLLTDDLVLCQGFLKQLGLVASGRRNQLGALAGRRNEANVNGTHPCMSAFLQTNGDVQLPYRFAITPLTHNDALCQDACYTSSKLREVIDAVQTCQDAQVGYTCDYQNKRAARSCNEVKECMKGHRRLHGEIQAKRPAYIGKRQVTRLCSDAYGKGICRSNQESVNLRIGGTEDVTSAESFHTASFVQFPGRDLVNWREAVYENASYAEMLAGISVDRRNPQRRTATLRNTVFLYGHRGCNFKALWNLSAYEFMVYWKVTMAEYAVAEDDDATYPAKLTESGRKKLKAQGAADLIPGEDYLIKASIEEDAAMHDDSWVALPDNEYTKAYRHDWIFERNPRPMDPTFAACPMPRRGDDVKERNAALIMTYFHPFTLNPDLQDEFVPFLGALCQAGKTWDASMLHWFDGRVLCAETKKYLDNFLAVTRTRPNDDEELQSDDQFSDDELVIDSHNFADVVRTRMGTGGKHAIAASSNPGEDIAEGEENNEAAPGTKEAFDFAHSMWEVPARDGSAMKGQQASLQPEDLDKALAAASASQKREYESKSVAKDPTEASIRAGKKYSSQDVWHWLEEKKKLKNKDGGRTVKKAQVEMLQRVCQRLCDELAEDAAEATVREPLMWMLHGGPGTGKSEVLKWCKELFRDVCGWEMGLEFQMMALQAVMAQLLGGDTIHHACGINPFPGKTDAAAARKASQRQTEVAERVLQWRWIFIDEISMVGAKLLAEIDMKLRAVMSDVATLKKDGRGHIRAFGGINIVFVGDFWQLDPPKGGFIAEIPTEFIRRSRKYDPKPDVAHGQSIFWSRGEGSVQGMTELTECVRTEDPWLLEVQEEMRAGRLSLDSWHFLHGKKTTVPGSWANGKCQCGNQACQDTWSASQVECEKCQTERQSKQRVMDGKNDTRHRSEHFLKAPAIFPNNDIKYEVNKCRAQIYAAEKNMAITWSIANDKASNKVLAEKPHILEEKKVWLTRHDRDCGNLYGVLPLIEGLPVMLTDHYDRNPEKQLLKGRIGYIKGWVTDSRETSEFEGGNRFLKYPPKVVLVQFFDWVKVNDQWVQRPCAWQLEGMSEPGVYPIKAWVRAWFLDQRRPHPVLLVRRLQAPLAPAYAITAHGSQGQTLVSAIIDLQIGRGVSAIASYVAMTRIRTRYDVLIFRAFAREVFTRGEPEGPSLLLQVLRGEIIDWEAIEAKHTPSARCRGPCLTLRFKDQFSEKEWQNKEDPHCKICLAKLKEQGKTHRCSRCRAWFPKAEFKCANSHLYGDSKWCVCAACKDVGLRKCILCEEQKPQSQFSSTRWAQSLVKRICLACSGDKSCSGCSARNGIGFFSSEEWKKPDGTRKCKECVPKRCRNCRKGKVNSQYSKPQRQKEEGKAVCYECDRKRCGQCNKEKGYQGFHPSVWEDADGSTKFSCKQCTQGQKKTGMWTCTNKRCKTQKPIEEFSVISAKCAARNTKPQSHQKICDECVRRREVEEAAMVKSNEAQIQKKSRTK